MRKSVITIALSAGMLFTSGMSHAAIPSDTQSVSQPLIRASDHDSLLAVNVLLPKQPFSYFRSALLGDAILLQWSLQNAHNEATVYLERDIDDQGFHTLTTINQQVVRAAFTDISPVPGARYRLRTIDSSGNSIYSTEILVPKESPVAGR